MNLTDKDDPDGQGRGSTLSLYVGPTRETGRLYQVGLICKMYLGGATENRIHRHRIPGQQTGR